MKNAKLLLLSCCAPCSYAVIEYLRNQTRNFVVLFYNPNIMPEQEYEKRKQENKKICAKFNIRFIDLDYDNARWLGAVAGLENEPERGERCKKCFSLRLEKAAFYAKENGFDILTSTLGVSRHKNLDDVNKIAAEIAAKYNIVYDGTNWRKGGLEERRRQLIKEENIYKQTYCGCKFSIDNFNNAK
ncbi:MAG: epoxyqueuosine reductase QueH [Elusimicrobiota bacterium]|jgi:predicted adenine nucleotide alpha hydrolase (AANH) superfamily ATPase|nr:epoxyqueuosine reductase QueH [Elusimicrobiota bacterium]